MIIGGARGRSSTVFVCFDRGDLLRVMGGPAHREADTLDLELGIHEMGWMDGMLLVGVCASVYLMRCPSFWSRPLSGYLFGIDWYGKFADQDQSCSCFLIDALLDQVDAVSGCTTRCCTTRPSTVYSVLEAVLYKASDGHPGWSMLINN